VRAVVEANMANGRSRMSFLPRGRAEAYVTYQRKDKVVAEVSASTGDLALLYVSRWKTPQAAERFAHFYADAVSQRYRNATVAGGAGLFGERLPDLDRADHDGRGPVIVEHWEDNSVIVSEGFDTGTAAKLPHGFCGMERVRCMRRVCRRKRLDCGC